MKKIKFGSIEVMGYIGIAIWIAVIICRGHVQWDNNIYKFWLGILPNLGAAWVMTMFAKWFVNLVLKFEYKFRVHIFTCIGIFCLALISEVIHDLFLNSPFDAIDIIITVIAQIFMIGIPLAIKDKGIIK